MGMDPSNCDPATIALYRNKFFGSTSAKSESKPKNKKANKKNKPVEEEVNSLLATHTESDIHLKTDSLLKKRGKAFSKNKEGKIQKEGALVQSNTLDFADILNEIEDRTGSKKQATDQDSLNTTRLKKQLGNLKKDGSKVLTTPLSGHAKVKLMR
jgi:U3 small nucleolar RNA-associated protein 14